MEDKKVLEQKLERIMQTLRKTLGAFDDDLISEENDGPFKKIKDL